MKILNPANNSLIREIEEDDEKSVEKKYDIVRKFQPEFAEFELSEKKEIISKFNDLLKSDIGELAKILTGETGKPISQSKNEITAVINRIQYFIDHVEEAINTEVMLDTPGMREEISYESIGVIANISAWNYPYFVGTNIFIPALLTGNTVLYKPSEFASLTGEAITKRLYESGLPEGAFQAIYGMGLVGAAVLKHDIDGLFFTGSYSIGKKIESALSGRLIVSQFELGGKDPAYVTDDTDLDNAVDALLDGALYNAGQSCCAVERAYVHGNVYDELLAKLTQKFEGIEGGDPNSEKTYLGPLTRSQQISVLDQQVEDALSKGAKIAAQGKSGPNDAYYSPKLLTDVNHEMKIMQEESFGPVLGLQKVMSDDEAVALMNDTQYGLTASVYCRDQNRARQILKKINSGTVYLNCCDRVSPYLPWTGRGHSGKGSTLSIVGIRAFVQPKAWQLRS